jgi:hypothetical protein
LAWYAFCGGAACAGAAVDGAAGGAPFGATGAALCAKIDAIGPIDRTSANARTRLDITQLPSLTHYSTPEARLDRPQFPKLNWLISERVSHKMMRVDKRDLRWRILFAWLADQSFRAIQRPLPP